MRSDHAGFQHQSHAEAVNAHIVADRMQAFCALVNECANQIFGDAAQAEATHHNRCAVRYVGDRLLRAGYYFVQRLFLRIAVATLDLDSRPKAAEIIWPAAANLFRSIPLSIFMPSNMYTTSSVATLPVAPGAYGHPPKPDTAASTTATPS